MVLGVDALAPGGAMAMVVPSSLLSARDAEAARRRVTETVDLVGLWVAVEPVFEASVDVCAPVVVRPSGSPGSGARPVVVGWRGRTFEGLGAVETAKGRVEPVPASWSPLALRALGVPDHDHRAGGTLAEICRGAGAFRDEYYGLVDHVSDTDVESMNDLPVGQAPLITSGLVDPGRCRWGSGPPVSPGACGNARWSMSWPSNGREERRRHGFEARPDPRWWWPARPGSARRRWTRTVGGWCPPRRWC